jgi:hypothetical protein
VDSRPSISYAAPETDDEDYEVSNDEDNEVPSSEDGVSIESPPHKISQAVNAIDLTRDDSPAESELEGTGETAVERNIKTTVTGQPADVDYNTDSVSNGPYTGNQPILVDSEDEAAQDPSDSDNHSEVQSAGDASSQADSMDEQESECEIESNYEMDVDAEAQPIDFAGRNSEPASIFTQLGSSLMDMPIPESNLRTTIDPADHLEEEDDDDGESEFGLSDAAAEGIRALFEIGSIDNVADSHFKVDEIDSHSVVACGVLKADDEIESPKRVTFTCPPPEQVTEMGSGYYRLSSVGQPQTEIPLNQPIMNLRQPSPSDAAMVKTTIPFSDPLVITANPIKAHHLPSQDFQKLTAQCLGEKTGKHAFFAAREDNRAKIYGRRDNYSGENSSLQTVKTCLSSVMEERRERSRIAMEKFKEKKRQIEEEINSKLLQSSQTFPTLPTTRVANSRKFFEYQSIWNETNSISDFIILRSLISR